MSKKTFEVIANMAISIEPKHLADLETDLMDAVIDIVERYDGMVGGGFHFYEEQ